MGAVLAGCQWHDLRRQPGTPTWDDAKPEGPWPPIEFYTTLATLITLEQKMEPHFVQFTHVVLVKILGKSWFRSRRLACNR